ncbi:Type 1 glutamine amidotransferase-like domain-containing protein [Anaerocolumna sp. AGMB13025]|uniref:Type 1 glutamine amidotransferase-like domain-containing protein n=1 Tax=Anaerocolumna sp. AGMB13025 TaxID=3039116 RepID=UPI00241EAA9D|nr:Type 1 glutamine amidotransferase-like domain-containing protein [Anaerocolumna sp. AGMB13025]WFR59483.1 Type 1 glutamine amidotransferase-like domain-containing protein [Anaerocolumna sp. AGMB13025]
MKKIILTSAGFENKKIEQKFLDMVNKPANEIKAIWIPTAAIDDDAKAVLPKCMDDLLNTGISPWNIETYNLDHIMRHEEMTTFDAVYVCGGNSRYLLDKMYEVKFESVLKKFINQGGVYIGVSAGSCICVNGFEDNLGFLPCTLSVHSMEGNISGDIDINDCSHINLTNNQAIIIEDEECYILE